MRKVSVNNILFYSFGRKHDAMVSYAGVAQFGRAPDL